MSQVHVTYHHEDGSWWAESADIEGFNAVAEDLGSLREMVKSGLDFYLDDTNPDIVESMESGAPVWTLTIVSSSSRWLGGDWLPQFPSPTSVSGLPALAPAAHRPQIAAEHASQGTA